MTARALLIVCVCAVAVTAMADPLDEGGQSLADRLKNRIKSAVPPAPTPPAPGTPPPSAPAPAPGAASPAPVADNQRFSDAEKAYVPAQATTRAADGPRRANLQPVVGSKFARGPGDQLTITNPYLALDRIFFAQAVALKATEDGGLIVGGRVELDQDMHALGTGYWRIAPDGAITPLHTRSTNTYGKTPATKCEAPYSRTHLDPENFATAAGGGLLKAIEYAVVKIGADGNVRRLAGAPFSCEESGQASQVRGQADGPADLARFNKASGIVADPEGNIWVVDQSGCSLRRITPAGQVTTVITPEQACAKTTPGEDRVGLDKLAWDPVHGELVTSNTLSVATPVHNLYTTVWRIKPSGEFRRVLYATKVAKSPARHHLDGVWSLAVDPEGRIHIGSRIMGTPGVVAVLRLDEAGATVTSVTGGSYKGGGDAEPKDGPADRALFRYIRDMSFAPDGTLYLLDEHLIRKLDKSGQVSTWAF
jgi:hypothetical protein